MTNYIKLAENAEGYTDLKVYMYYCLGGYNNFTSTEEKRGYYLSVCPVVRGNGFESYRVFSGVKKCIKEVKRQSKKAESEAEKLMEIEKENLIAYVLNEQGLKLESKTA